MTLIQGQYDMSLSSWVYQEKRSKVLSFSTYILTEYFLVTTPNVPSLDLGLLLRPLTTSAWKGISGLVLAIYLATLVTKSRDLDDTAANRRMLGISTGIFFVLLNSFYGGAMTMFFVNEAALPFENIHQVIRAYPEWELLVQNGTESVYMEHVKQGDADYKALMDRVDADSENLV